MLRKPNMSLKNNNKGIATFEAVFLMIFIIMFMTFTVGTFGIVHTGVLYSISSRAYAFETMRNRANVYYFRDQDTDKTVSYARDGFRAHAVISETANDSRLEFVAPKRKLAYLSDVETVDKDHKNISANANAYINTNQNTSYKSNPVWIKTVYGICLRSSCERIN